MTNTHDFVYSHLVEHVLHQGESKPDRTGTGTYSVFGYQMRFDMHDGFPLLTTKRVNYEAIVDELFWFISGSTNINDLKHTRIWNEWADQYGDLGPVYGAQWRGTENGFDQLLTAQNLLRNAPNSRRILIDSWDVKSLHKMRLPPCHMLMQFHSVRDDRIASGALSPVVLQEPHSMDEYRRLDLQVYQRSADVFLGVPFNIASYSMLLCMMAEATGHIPGSLIWTGGDVHLYRNHVSQAREQLTRPPRTSPRLALTKPIEEGLPDITQYEREHIRILDYHPHEKISAPIAV